MKNFIPSSKNRKITAAQKRLLPCVGFPSEQEPTQKSHTAGPWSALLVRQTCGNTDLGLHAKIVNEKTQIHICDLQSDARGEYIANARLIAAAPEMLAALRFIFQEIEGLEDGSPDASALCKSMNPLIAKARSAIVNATE